MTKYSQGPLRLGQGNISGRAQTGKINPRSFASLRRGGPDSDGIIKSVEAEKQRMSF
jgi:hypothetical protein